tara:strand:- start:633 stop:1778 length:1146 start_codon:yes stop_codon:yes gene_type:complete
LIIWRACYGFETSSQYLGRNLSDGVRGATINAISSSVPELFTTAFFLIYLKDTDGFSGGIGTTAGSAIFNGMVIPALVILTVIYFIGKKNIEVSKKIILRDGISLIIAELILILIISGNELNWWHGAILMLTYFVYLFYMLFKMDRTGNEINNMKKYDDNKDEEEVIREKNIINSIIKIDLEEIIIGKKEINNYNASILLFISTLIIGTSCLLLVYACEIIGADKYTIPILGEFYGLDIPILFVAVILASAATSVPDTVISVRDAKQGNYNDAISNALGSNIFDICFALGLPLFLFCIFYGPINMNPDTIKFSSELRILLLILTIASFMIFYFGKTMGKFKAFLLLIIYGLFTVYIVSLSSGFSWAILISDFLEKIYSIII